MIIVLRQLLANPLHPGIAAVWQLKPRRIKSNQHNMLKEQWMSHLATCAKLACRTACAWLPGNVAKVAFVDALRIVLITISCRPQHRLSDPIGALLS